MIRSVVERMRFPLVFMVVLFIPLGTRLLLLSFTSGFHEYETAFFYVGDIFVILCAMSALVLYKGNTFRVPKIIIVLLVLVLGSAFVSLFSAPLLGLAVYQLVRLILLVLFALACGMAFVTEKRLRIVALLLLALGILESVIAGLQFKLQHALGLSFVGESPISVMDPSTSRIITDGVYGMRAYGTFPHPNILGAFLVLSVFALLYLWFSVRIPKLQVTRKNWKHEFIRYRGIILLTIMLSLALFIISMGLVLTFSRSAWIVGTLILLVPIYALRDKNQRMQAVKFLVIFGSIAWMLFHLFSPWIIPRSDITSHERSVSERVSYLNIAKRMILMHPMGVGLGNQVFSGVQEGLYLEYGVQESWKWQPVHTIYLLASAEIGIIGGFSFLLFLMMLVYYVIRDHLEFQHLWVAVLLFGFIIFGFLDHFLWTLWQGQLMLWFVIGIAFAHLRSRS